MTTPIMTATSPLIGFPDNISSSTFAETICDGNDSAIAVTQLATMIDAMIMNIKIVLFIIFTNSSSG